MTRKPWMFAALLLASLATSRLTAQVQFGPPASGNTSAILFAPATLNLVAGNFVAGYGGDGGPANSATTMLSGPIGMKFDSNGNLFIADSANHVVRRIDHATGDISTFAGQQANAGFSIGGGVATSAQMQSPSGLVVDSNNNVYVADRSNNVVFMITPAGAISIFAGSGTIGYGGDGGSATAPAAKFNNIWDLGIDSSNNIYIADTGNNLIRKVTQAGNLSTFAGDVADVSGCNSSQYSTGAPPYTAFQVHLCFPQGVAFDFLGNAYITDTKNDVIYKVDNSGNLTLFAGTFNTPGFSGDGGPATSAWFDLPAGLYADPAGRVYISDFFSGRIRVVDSLGNINTVFGTGFGDLGKASIGEPDTEAVNVTSGPANGIYDFALDIYGNIVATDSSSNAVTSAGSTGQYVFPEQYVFEPSAPKYVTVENPSGVPLDFLGTPTLTGPYTLATGASAGTCNFSGMLPPGQTCTIGIVFTPIVDDPKNPGSLTLTTNANSSPSTISLFGMSYGTGTTLASLVGPGPSFTAVVGQTSASQAATLTNDGQEPITITSAVFGGIDPTAFAVSSTTCPSGAATLASGASCVYNITFTPTNTTTESASFTVTIANYGQLGVSINGVGTAAGAPTASLTPTTVPFESVNSGTTSAPMSLRLSNAGNATLNITGISIAGANPSDFAVSTGANACGTTLAAGSSCSIYVTFTPASASSFTATLQVADNATGSPQSSTLTGTGTAPTASLSPTLSFPSTATGTPSGAMTATLSNMGTSTLNITGISIAGANPSDFAIATGANACGTTLAAGSSCSIYVTFTPASASSFTATLEVADNATGSPQSSTLAGTGTPAQLGQLQFTPSLISLFAGNSQCSRANPITPGPAINEAICAAVAVVTDSKGNEYILDQDYNSVYKVDPSGNLTVYAGVPTIGDGSYGGDNGPAANALMSSPLDIVVDSSDNLYISDYGNSRIREVNATTGVITTFAGFGKLGFFNGGTTATAALGGPQGMTFDPSGNLYVSNGFGMLVLKIDTSLNVTLFAGQQVTSGSSAGEGIAGYAGDGGQAINATLSDPNGLASDQQGNIYIADTNNYVIRKVDTSGKITTYAGNHTQGDSGDNGPASSAEINAYGVSTDLAGDLYITGGIGCFGASNCANIVRKVDTSGNITTYAGGGTGTVPGPATGVALTTPYFARIDNNGDLIIPTNQTVESAGPQGILQFGTENVGVTSNPLTLTLTNTGNGQLVFAGVPGTGDAADAFCDGACLITGDFTVTGGTCNFGTLAPGASCTLTITFTPTQTGARTGVLTLGTFTPNGESTVPETVQLSGTGGAAAAAAATLTPNPIAFPSTTVGSTASAITATLSNTGNATLNITGITIAGADPTDFALATGANACGSTLAAGASCSIYVTFTPASAASFSATLSVADNAAGSPQSSTLTGTGTTPPAPVASLAPATVPFGSLTAGTTSAAMSATLSNTGNATLNISGITIAGANPSDFAIATGANACGTTLAADATCTIYVTFTPASASSFTATLQVADDATGSPQTSILTGTGTAPPAPAATLAPNPVAFASEAIGATSAATTVTLTNSGTATLTITGITITGTNPTEFAMTTGSNACGSSLEAGATCNIYVTFTPAAGASYSATLSVADNATGSPQTVPLSGSGINPADFAVSATPASQTVHPGGSTTYAVSVSSTGGTFSSPIGLTVSGLPSGATGSFSPTSITPGSESAASTLTVQTGTTTQQTAHNSAWPLAAPALAALGLFFLPGKRRRRWITLGVLLVASLGTLTALSGCGGGFSFVQPSQTYTLTITGTSGNDTHSTTVQLTVQ